MELLPFRYYFRCPFNALQPFFQSFRTIQPEQIHTGSLFKLIRRRTYKVLFATESHAAGDSVDTHANKLSSRG